VIDVVDPGVFKGNFDHRGIVRMLPITEEVVDEFL